MSKEISNHIFMFPFTIQKQSDEGFMGKISNIFNMESNWVEETFEVENNWQYNEYHYFYPFVRDALYSKKEKDNDSLLKYFKREDFGDKSEFILHIKGKEEPYNLKLNHISLRIYETHIGILSFELVNSEYKEFDDILKINDFGRRIYPQFLGEVGTETTKKSFLADRIVIKSNTGFFSEEPFDDECKFRKKEIVVADYIHKLLGNDLEYTPIIDDRMFVVCWYSSKEWSEKLQENYFAADKWYQYLFVDGKSVNCQHPEMTKNLIEKSTYERWANYGTFFGITRYSMVCIENGDFVRQHMRKHYAQIAVILLAQRASILHFSDRVTDISGMIENLENENEISKEVKNLHASYIRFVNRIWFTEITPQEQGIEMYEKALEIMKTKENVNDLKSEIKELYEFVGLSQDRSSNQQMKTLTILGGIFLPLVTLTGILGINLYFINEEFKIPDTLISIVIFVFLCFLAYRFTINHILLIGEMEKDDNSGIIKYLSLKMFIKSITKFFTDLTDLFKRKKGSKNK